MSPRYLSLLVTLLIVGVAFSSANPLETEDSHLRIARSPQGGSVTAEVLRDRSGHTGTVTYEQNLWQGNKGNTRLDAYAGASKNFDHHGRPDAHGGLTFTHNFPGK